MYLVWAVGMLMTAGFGLANAVWQAMIVSFVAEASIALLIVIWYTALQRIVPDHFLGRVMSLDWMITIAGLPLSFAVVGPLAQWIGVDTTLILAGVVGAAVTIGGMFIPGALAPERDGRLAEPTAAER
jgi:DHA3 family tetracycline resistance protein-like MFS transporter